jgi:integrase
VPQGSSQQANLVVLARPGAAGKAYWDARWRYRTSETEPWKLIQRRLGLAWQEPNGSGGWRKRRGRCPEGWLDERAANVAAVAAMEAHARELVAAERQQAQADEALFRVRELAKQWLEWLAEVRGAKPSTIADYAFLLREPNQPHRRGPGASPGRIMAAFGDRSAKDVTTKDVSNFLRSLDRAGLTPRNVNKHRQILSAMFAYGCRGDSFDLPRNPVDGTDKRRENPPPALDYYEIEEVEALARCCERGEHRTLRPGCVEPSEAAARQAEDRQDAEAFRLLFYTGLRLGEVITLRWDDVNLSNRLLLVRRGLSAGEETLPKGRRHRFVPLSSPAVSALARLADRTDYLAPDDYVLANRLGRRLDPSALRRRYKRGCAAAGLRSVRLHGLRHAAGSLVARTSDAVFVRDFLGHSKLATTDRYLSAKLRPEELERLDRAFTSASAQAADADAHPASR